jgi:hypothetical protein
VTERAIDPEQVKAIWERTESPSYKKVQRRIREELGLEVSVTSIRRYKKNGWKTGQCWKRDPAKIRTPEETTSLAIRTIPDKALRKVLRGMLNAGTFKEARENSKSISANGFSAVWLIFLSNADMLFKTNQAMAVAEIIKAMAMANDSVSQPIQQDTDSIVTVKDVTPRREEPEDHELSQFMEG